MAGPVCRAPWLNLHFLPDGEARVCSRSMLSLGNVRDRTVRELWDSAWRAELVRRISVDDLSAGCQSCAAEFGTLGRTGSIAAEFDLGPGGSAPLEPPPRLPVRMDFMLSNTCNLQCVQCHGAFSSAIRRHREHRPPLVSPYGDAFVAQLSEFLPHLAGAQFAGGEPFLVPVNYRIWELIGDVSPELECFIITNGTRWTGRVEAALAGLRAHVLVSMDGISKGVYESIRVGAELEEVLRNLDRFADHARAVGTTVSLNFCLMRQNYRDFARMCRFAESKGIRLNVLIVREPSECSILTLPTEERDRVIHHLERESDSLLTELDLNRPVWELQLHRLRRLVGGAPAAETLVMFPRSVPGRPVTQPPRPLTPGTRPGVRLHRVALSAGSFVHQPDSLLAPLPNEVLSQAIEALGVQDLGYGELLGHEPIEMTDDAYRADVVMERGRGEILLAVRRDEAGRATEVEVQLAVTG